MSNAALFDLSASSAFAQFDLGAPAAKTYVGIQLYRTAAQTAATVNAGLPLKIEGDLGDNESIFISAGGDISANWDYDTGPGAFTSDTWHQFEMLWQPTVTPTPVAFDAAAGVDNQPAFLGENVIDVVIGGASAFANPGEGIYVGHVWIGTDAGLHDLLQEDWSSGDFSRWTSHFGAASVVTAPVAPPAFVPSMGGGGGPTADFIATPLSGHIPLAVQFTDLSTGGPTTWAWDFGDGDTSSDENPLHVYAAAGVYDVTLTAT